MFHHRAGAFVIGLGGGVEIHMVAEFVAEGDGVGMIMVAAAVFLVAEAGIEGDAFVHIGVALPDAVALADAGAGGGVAAVRVGIGEGVIGIEDGHAIDGYADVAKALPGVAARGNGMAREAEDDVLVGGQVGEGAETLRVVIPGAHDLAAEAGAADIDPVRGDHDLLHAGVGRGELLLAAVAPDGFGEAGGFFVIGAVDAGGLAGMEGEP